jgi:hypothetical protein
MLTNVRTKPTESAVTASEGKASGSEREVMYAAEPLPEFGLDELLAKITPENVHPETATGSAVGNEFA